MSRLPIDDGADRRFLGHQWREFGLRIGWLLLELYGDGEEYQHWLRPKRNNPSKNVLEICGWFRRPWPHHVIRPSLCTDWKRWSNGYKLG